MSLVVVILAVGWLGLIGLAQMGNLMVTACRENVFTPECETYRSANSATFFAATYAVLLLGTGALGMMVSSGWRRRGWIIAVASVIVMAVITVAAQFARSLPVNIGR